MEIEFKFKHPCGVTLRPGNIYNNIVLSVSYKQYEYHVYVGDVPKEAENNITSNNFNDIMIGVAQVIRYVKETKPYATGYIKHLEDVYNAWQEWCFYTLGVVE